MSKRNPKVSGVKKQLVSGGCENTDSKGINYKELAVPNPRLRV